MLLAYIYKPVVSMVNDRIWRNQGNKYNSYKQVNEFAHLYKLRMPF